MPTVGMPTTTSPGSEEDIVKALAVFDIGDGALARFDLESGYDQYARIVVDGVAQGAATFCRSGDLNELIGLYESPDTTHAVSVALQGDWAGDNIDVSAQQINFQAGRSDRIHADVEVSPTVFSYGDSGQLTGWTLTGFKRFANLQPNAFRPAWGTLDIFLSTSGGIHTLSLKVKGVTMAEGALAGNGNVLLLAQNNSGLSGTVTLTYSADITGDSILVVRYPAQIKMHQKTTPFTAPDFPRTADGTLYDDMRSNNFPYRSARLAAATYYVVAHQQDENGNEGTSIQGGGATIVLLSPPEPPGVPLYASGGAAATTISFVATSTVGATYQIYDSLETGIVSPSNVAGTHIAGVGTLSQTLGAISGTFTGIRYILVRAVSTVGTEEGNANVLEIEYSAGVVVLPRPPVPGVGQPLVISGRSLTVPVFFDTRNTLGVAATIEIYLATIPSAGGAPTFNYAVADASVAVPTAIDSIIQTSITVVLGSDGDRYYALRTKTAGGTSSDNTEFYGPVRLTTVPDSDPQSVQLREGL